MNVKVQPNTSKVIQTHEKGVGVGGKLQNVYLPTQDVAINESF
jgi:hypothetical protein